ncbi:MAG: M15 family metallopeptidase [Saprospiraceae bacterium]|nr:M15 family metallopeptidase [Saprospiraceae bacterium]
MSRPLVLFLLWATILFACKENSVKEGSEVSGKTKAVDQKESKTSAKELPRHEKTDHAETKSDIPTAVDENFTEITTEDDIFLDIKYATKDNFTKKIIYPCGKCYLRPRVAKRLLTAKEALQKEYGYSLKMFDCYRPRPAQQRLWDVVPNPDYVTPPAKGSMHNRGLAVDLTLVDKNGKELDMGTPYDFFGPKAHTDNMELPEEVLTNRNLLKNALQAQSFSGIRTEWWHFSYNEAAGLSDWEWPCN